MPELEDTQLSLDPVQCERVGTRDNKQQAMQVMNTKLVQTIIIPILHLPVRPESITGSNLTRVKKLAFFTSRSFDVTEAADRDS